MSRAAARRDDGSGRTAVIALDLISDFSFPDGPKVRRGLAACADAIARLLAAARRSRVPVIYVNDAPGPWRSDSAELLDRCMRPGLPGSELVRSLAPEPDDAIVLKPRHSAFFGTPLESLLSEKRVETLLLLGVSAESCVWMTACDAHTRGYTLVVPRDTLAGASPRAMTATITVLRDVLKARVPARASSLRFRTGKLA